MGVDLAITLGGARLANPIVTASGCFGSGKEMSRFVDLRSLGAVVCKTVTPEPRLGISPPRGAETASGMLNAIGLQNPGVAAFREGDLVWLAERNVPAIASVGGHSVADYVRCIEALRGAAGLVAIAEAATGAGADGLSLINTTLGMAIDPLTFRAKLSTGTGGLSGPAIKPIAVRCIWQVHRALPHVPIIGMGGIAGVEDAVEMILAGATAVAVGTANFYDPTATETIARALADFCEAHGIASLDEIRGQVKIEG